MKRERDAAIPCSCNFILPKPDREKANKSNANYQLTLRETEIPTELRQNINIL